MVASNNLRKQGQSEIIGLLAIVMLLIFLGLVYIGFLSFQEQSYLPTVRTSIEAENALKAAMKVTVSSSTTIEALIVQCSQEAHACVLLEEALTEIYTAILLPRERFSFSFSADDAPVHAFGSCNLGVTSHYTFIKDYVFYDVQLKLCKVGANS